MDENKEDGKAKAWDGPAPQRAEGAEGLEVVGSPSTSSISAPLPTLGPKRPHPAWIVLSVLRQLRGFLIPIVILLIGGGPRGEGTFLAIGGAIAALVIGFQVVGWLFFSYEVSGGELRVRSGVISRRERLVPLERIQAVDTSESVLQRLFGVVGVRIETAAGGSSGSDVTLEALSRAEAEALLARIAAGRTTAGIASSPGGVANQGVSALDAGGELLRRVTPGELLVAGLTSGRVGPALALLVAGWQFVDDIIGEERFAEEVTRRLPDATIPVVAGIVTVIAVVAWLLAIAGTVLTYANFELRRAGDRLLISHGLLDRRRSTIPLRRIQAVTVSEGLLRQPFGLASVRVESAGYGRDSAESGVLFPIIRRSEIPALLRLACPPLAVPEPLLDGRGLRPLPARARRRYVTGEIWQTLMLAAGATLLTALLPWTPWWWGLGLLGLVPVAALYGWVQYRDAGWTIDEAERFVLRTRGLARQVAIVPRRRVQIRSLSQTVLQRRADLANVQVAVASGGAGGRFALRHLDLDGAGEIADRLGPGSTASVPISPAAVSATSA
jgi:putative membrane protein